MKKKYIIEIDHEASEDAFIEATQEAISKQEGGLPVEVRRHVEEPFRILALVLLQGEVVYSIETRLGVLRLEYEAPMPDEILHQDVADAVAKKEHDEKKEK